LKSLTVSDDHHPFDGEFDEGNLASKLTIALQTNRLLETLRFTISKRMATNNQSLEMNDHQKHQQQVYGELLGVALVHHPAVKELELTFLCHRNFFGKVLSAVSTSQRLQSLTLEDFDGTKSSVTVCFNYYVIPVSPV